MTALATEGLVRWLALATGLVLAAALVSGWRVPSGGGTLGAEAAFVAVPPGELTAEPAVFLRARELRAGGDTAKGTLRVRNISPRRQRVRVRMEPSNRDLDRALYVQLTSGGRRIAAGQLGRLRRPSRRSLSIAPGESAAIDARMRIRAGAKDYEGRLTDVSVSLVTSGPGR